MKLVACPGCHAQYDVAGIQTETIVCPCGRTFSSRPPVAVDAAVTRCAACGALVGETETTCSYCRAEIERKPAPAGPVCPECYARNPERARYCAVCGVAFRPQPARTDATPLGCPVCTGSRLVPRAIGGLWVDECPRCLGLWAPGDTMDQLVERIRERRRKEATPSNAGGRPTHRAAWQAQVTYRHCPACGAAMQRRNFGNTSGVVVDWCGSHGTWLDAHEMEDIASFVFTEPTSFALPADPNRVAAIAAAERILAEERSRQKVEPYREGELLARSAIKGIGDLLARWLK